MRTMRIVDGDVLTGHMAPANVIGCNCVLTVIPQSLVLISVCPVICGTLLAFPLCRDKYSGLVCLRHVNVFERGKPGGGNLPAWARLPIQSAMSFCSKVR